MVDSRIHVRPYQWNGGPRDAASFVRNLDGDIFLALCNNDLGHRELLLIFTMSFHHSTKRVLEGLEEHMRQMSRHVHEADVRITYELDLWCVKESVVILANEARILNSFLGEFLDIGLCANYSDVVGIGPRALVCQGDVLADEHTNTDTRHVETVEESLDIVVNLHPLSLAFPLKDALRNGGHDAVVPPLDLLQCVCELCVVCAQLWWPVLTVVSRSIVSSACALDFLCDATAVSVRISVSVAIRRRRGPVLSSLDARVLGRLAHQVLVAALLGWF